MSEVYGRACTVYVDFRVSKAFPVISWSGSFVSGLIHSSLGSAVKPVSVLPLHVDGRPFLSSRVVGGKVSSKAVLEGSKASFRLTFYTKHSLDHIISRLQALESRGLMLNSINFEEVRLPKDSMGIVSDNVAITVEFMPTIFAFKGSAHTNNINNNKKNTA